MSKRLDLGPENPSGELLTYGGLFDICNGTTFQTVDMVRLKTAALFYDRIIVEDGYFHCYGPIHTHFSNLIRSGRDPAEDELAQLIEAGIVVPALRTGESLHDNFAGSVRGIAPGKFLTLPNTNEARRVLRLVDDLVHEKQRGKYAVQPNSLQDQVVANFSKLVGQSMYGSDSRISVVTYLDQDGLGGIHNSRKLELLRLAGDVREVANKTGFRRGAVENCIRERLGFDSTEHIYGRLVTHCESGANTPGEIHVALYLLWVASTAYELTHAAEFGTVGGLFSSHEPHLVTTGIFDHLNDVVKYDFRGLQSNSDFMGGVLDFSRLSVRDIVELRESEVVGLDTPLFQTYRSHFQRWLKGPQSESDIHFESAHRAFIDFLHATTSRRSRQRLLGRRTKIRDSLIGSLDTSLDW